MNQQFSREIAFRNNIALVATIMVARASARGKMIRKVSRHNKQVVEMLDVFGPKTTKCFKGDSLNNFRFVFDEK